MRPATPSALVALLIGERSYLERRLLEEGALLFRGFGLRGAADLARIVATRRGPALAYVGGDSPRRQLQDGVYTSTDCPPHITLPLHNEMSYLPSYPRHLFFHCAEPASSGGETTLADGRAVYQRLDPLLRERFEREGVRYQLSFRGPGGFYALLDRVQKVTKSWMEAFETSDRGVIDEQIGRWGAQHRWLPGGRLVIELLQPATREHPESGQPVWFNQAHLFKFSRRLMGLTRLVLAHVVFPLAHMRPHAWYGDGREIESGTLEQVADALDACTSPVAWQRGDLLWVDNLRCLHGRLPFQGQRRVLVSMTDD